MKKKIVSPWKIVSISINRIEYEQLKADAKVMGYTISAYIRELWKDYKTNKEKK